MTEKKTKNAIVTGSNRGIGSVVLEELASRGCNVWACARKPNPEFEARLKVLAEKFGVWIKPVCFELSNEEEIKAGIKSILSEKSFIIFVKSEILVFLVFSF